MSLSKHKLLYFKVISHQNQFYQINLFKNNFATAEPNTHNTWWDIFLIWFKCRFKCSFDTALPSFFC